MTWVPNVIDSNGFVADGHERARDGIRAQIEAEYDERLKKATPEEAVRIRQEMVREMELRVSKMAPHDALY